MPLEKLQEPSLRLGPAATKGKVFWKNKALGWRSPPRMTWKWLSSDRQTGRMSTRHGGAVFACRSTTAPSLSGFSRNAIVPSGGEEIVRRGGFWLSLRQLSCENVRGTWLDCKGQGGQGDGGGETTTDVINPFRDDVKNLERMLRG